MNGEPSFYGELVVNGEFPKRLRQEPSERQIGEFVEAFPVGGNHNYVGAATNYTSHSPLRNNP